MLNFFKKEQVQILDRHLKEITICSIPEKGWINAIRNAISMSTSQLAKRLGVSKQNISQFELNEKKGSITITSLSRVAEALDCQLVYAIVPNEGSLKQKINKQALKKAKELIVSVDHTMMLESQNTYNMETSIKDLAKELEKNINSKLWD